MTEVLEKERCTGCTACFSICPVNAISMKPDSEGFLYPCIDEQKCINCKLCVKTCPVQNEQMKNPVLDSYIAINKDISKREESASGGIFSNLAEWTLLRGGVVFGAAYTNGLVVKHISIEKLEELPELRMSKYVQSNVTGTFKEVKEYLLNDRWVLYSGTPCEIAGLKAYLRKDYDRLILMDVVCHGIPSPMLFEDYKKEIEKKYHSNIKRIFFRSKIIGHALSTIAVEFEDGRMLHSTRIIKSFPRLWFAGFISRPSCYNCHYKDLDRVSDFTLFDSFKSAPKYGFNDDDMGLSNVYVRTQKGWKIWNEIYSNVNSIQTDHDYTSKMDGDMIFESAIKNPRRKEFWKKSEKMSYTELIDDFIPYSIKEGLMDWMKRIMVRTGLNRNLPVKKILSKLK